MENKNETEKLFLKLYDENAEALFRYCYFRVSSREIAEDLMQESFMRVWNYLAEGNTIDTPKAFLYRIASNLIIDHYRHKKEMSLDTLVEGGYDPVGEGASSITDFASAQHLLRLLDELDSQSREILTLRYVSDLSVTDIAKVIGQSENVVSVRIHRAIEKLKKLFQYGKPH
jgi:RNA polymerase sigma-70 factor (ECF subfamily)